MTANFASGTVWTGDNLPVMRGMNSASVDLIYLDPPFNSGKDYEAPIGSEAAGAHFKDTWTLDDVDVHEHGELADRNPAAYLIVSGAGAAHGKSMRSYLIYMATRLLEMRRILKPNGGPDTMPRPPALIKERDLKGCETPEQLVRALFRPRRAAKPVASDKPPVGKPAANHHAKN